MRITDMKITVILKEVPKQPATNLQDLKSGTVVTLSDGSINALVIDNVEGTEKKLILLTNCDGDWFAEPGGWADMPIHSVVGKITEIIVEEI